MKEKKSPKYKGFKIECKVDGQHFKEKEEAEFILNLSVSKYMALFNELPPNGMSFICDIIDVQELSWVTFDGINKIIYFYFIDQ